MKNTRQLVLPMKRLLTLLLFIAVTATAAENASSSAQMHLERAETLVASGSMFAAIEEYRQAIEKGMDDAHVRRGLALLLYSQGFLTEAIAAMQRAVELDGSIDYLHHELGVYYFAGRQWTQARDEFRKTLEINPGSSDTHYYLAHLFLRQKNLTAARLFANSARQLGHAATDLIELFGSDDQQHGSNVWLAEKGEVHLRQIHAASRREAERIQTRLAAGELFERIARDRPGDPNSRQGGYLGGFPLKDLQPAIASTLADRDILHLPLIFETGSGANIIQKIAPLDWSYLATLETGIHPSEDRHDPGTDGEATGPTKSGYLVWAGAFSEPGYAEERLARLRHIGLEGQISVGTQQGRELFNVSAGNGLSRSEAQAILRLLIENGLEGYIAEEK